MRAAKTLAALAALLLPAAAAAQQPDSTRLVAGPEYEVGALREGLFGDDYRDLWTSPVQVQVLDLGSFAGGLTPTERGGGEQTRSLRFRGADGREYAFRSVNKYPNLSDDPALEGTIVATVLQDQVSSLHPAANLVVAPLLDVAGVLHVSPRLVVMPDDPRLGEFRRDFAGMLGTIEERPDDREDGNPGFAGFENIESTPDLLERLEESPEDRVDTRAYLKARLMDLWLGDWDRHEDQWRWAGQERDGATWWLPIPRDRDYAFVDYDGILPGAAKTFIPNAVSFGEGIDNVYGLTLNARALDRRLLVDLERAVWDSMAVHLQGVLTDAVIDDAVRRMPAPYAERSAERIARFLRTRRDDLPDAARRYYSLMSSEVDVHATDERDVAVIDRTGEDVVDVRIYAGDTRGEPWFRRRFVEEETNEVRLFLHGGDDQAVVRGEVGESLMIRVIGGGGDDLLADSSVVRNERSETAFYDDRGENRFLRGPETLVDTRPFELPQGERTLGGETFRDWGRRTGLGFSADYQNPDGPIVGVSRTVTRFGFRADPYAFRLKGKLEVAPLTRNAEVELTGDFRHSNSRTGYGALFRASQLEVLRFYGYGNDTPAREVSSRYVVPQDVVTAAATATFQLPGDALLAVGPVVRYTNPDVPDDHPVGDLGIYGSSGFGQVGALTEASFDRVDDPGFPRRGTVLRLGGSGYPGVWTVDEAFGEAHAEALAFLPVPFPLETTLALRGGGRQVWGTFPVHEAAFLGGSETIRGFSTQRFAGDAAAYGNAEVRVRLFPAELLVHGDLGVLGLADAGRVYLDGESPGGWHTAYGGGLWFRVSLRERTHALSLTYVKGERGRFYAKIGMPF